MQNHDFCIICRQHGNCKGMTHLSLVWAVTSIPTDSVSEFHGLCSTLAALALYISICTVPAILWPRGIYVCSTWNHIFVWRKHETTGSWPNWFPWRLVFSLRPFFWASKTFHHGALGPTGPEANVLRPKKWELREGRCIPHKWFCFGYQ